MLLTIVLFFDSIRSFNSTYTMSEEYASEIHKFLKIGDNLILPKVGSNPPDLSMSEISYTEEAHSHTLEKPLVEAKEETDGATEQATEHKTKLQGAKGYLKNLILYPVIFAVSFGVFYVILNFNSLAAQLTSYINRPKEDQEILKENYSEYYKWIGGYYFTVKDQALLEPNHDIDKDGLTNLDEFIIKTNPTLHDTDRDGTTDGVEVINGSNPWGLGDMTRLQEKLIKDLDLIRINNRISYNVASNKGNLEEAIDTTVAFDLEKPGKLSIPKLNLTVPVIWSKTPEDFEIDLTRGVVHYPGTVLPGQNGTAYISGHSSDYFWKRNPFGSVFARINFLQEGDDVFMDLYGKDGKVYNFEYKVSKKNIYSPDDQSQFIDNSKAQINLSTCWPIGTQKDRYVVTAVLKDKLVNLNNEKHQ